MTNLREQTQANTSPGNCWQAAVACVLDVDQAELPPQCEIEAWNNQVLGGWGSYSNVLNGYLTKHHSLEYSTVYERSFSAIQPIHGYHVICGPSVRTPDTGSHHCVVGHLGVEVWDPHPTRAGLTQHTEWGVFGERRYRPPSIMRERNVIAHDLVFGCLCSECNLDRARELAHNFEAQSEDQK